jgi:hypothetical protein
VLVAISSDGIGWANFGSLRCDLQLRGAFWLKGYVGVAVLAVLGKDACSNLDAQVTVDAGPIDVELAGCVLWNSFIDVCHRVRGLRLTAKDQLRLERGVAPAAAAEQET